MHTLTQMFHKLRRIRTRSETIDPNLNQDETITETTTLDDLLKSSGAMQNKNRGGLVSPCGGIIRLGE